MAGFGVGRAQLRKGGTDEAVGVPGGAHRDLAHVQAGGRRIDDHAAADVHRDVPDPVVVQQVTRLDLGHRDVRQRRPLLVGVARDRDPGRRPGGHHQARAVETDAAGAGRASWAETKATALSAWVVVGPVYLAVVLPPPPLDVPVLTAACCCAVSESRIAFWALSSERMWFLVCEVCAASSATPCSVRCCSCCTLLSALAAARKVWVSRVLVSVTCRT